jgi:2-polyprenyl-6-methoxyphenol hydroxylase-like FAD-dependent oxidoreductase
MAKGRRGPDVPFPDTWLIPQSSTTRALHARLESLGGRVEFGTELRDVRTDGNLVTARVSASGSTEEITARYLVGADGGASPVRHQLGVRFSGSTDDADRILIVDATVSGRLSRRYWHIWPGLGGRFVGACPLPHTDLFQWMIRLAPGEHPPEGAEHITSRIRSHTGDSQLALRDIAWQSVFRPNIRLAEHYRSGRVLLAGDAAHVHTPAGAQGLNTGIGDAYNLGWKLAQVLAGADPALLDTYEAERRPVAAGVLGLSTRKYQGIGRLNPSSYRRGKQEKQLALSYHGGPLASSATDCTATDRTATLRVGDRAPDADLLSVDGEQVRLFDAYRGPHFTAIGYGRDAAAALSQLDWPAGGAALIRLAVDAGPASDGAALIDGKGHFRRIYGLNADALLLIRPDGYIGHIALEDFARGTGRGMMHGYLDPTGREHPMNTGAVP